MSRNLYMHETIDIVGDGAAAYMEHLVHGRMSRPARSEEQRPTDRGLMGTFSVVGTTGRWPQVINLSQTGDWEAWGRLVQNTYVNRRGGSGAFLKGEELQQWWREAMKTRTGGFDRVLGSVEGCPTMSELRERGIRGSVFVHEISEVRPGSGPEYLGAVHAERRPILGEYGVELVGLYEVMFHNTEVITVWASHVPNLVKLQQANDEQSPPGTTDDRLVKWRSTARQFLTRQREELMVPYSGSMLAPSE